MTLHVNLVRQQFSSLNHPAIFLDNPAGTQISKQSLDRINRYLLECNANHEGLFETSRKSDEVLHEDHAAMADFLDAWRPEDIIFGNNMTTLTLHISRSLARNLQPGDNILVTRLDHDANISPWISMWNKARLTWRILQKHSKRSRRSLPLVTLRTCWERSTRSRN